MRLAPGNSLLLAVKNKAPNYTRNSERFRIPVITTEIRSVLYEQ